MRNKAIYDIYAIKYLIKLAFSSTLNDRGFRNSKSFYKFTQLKKISKIYIYICDCENANWLKCVYQYKDFLHEEIST